jgi:hypothetical protein
VDDGRVLPFFSPERCWPAGQRRLHVYLLPDVAGDEDGEAVVRLAGQAQRVAGAGTRAVAREWLHVTVAAAIDPDCDREVVVEALAGVISRQEVFRLRMGSALATTSAIQLDADDVDGGFWVLQHDVVSVLDQVAGGGRDGGAPHMAVAYGSSATDSGPISSRLRQACRPPHALWRVDRAYIVDVVQHVDDVDGAAYRWGILATVPLATKSATWGYVRSH